MCFGGLRGLGDFDWLINGLIQSDMAKGQIRRLSLFFSTLQIDTGVNFTSFKVLDGRFRRKGLRKKHSSAVLKIIGNTHFGFDLSMDWSIDWLIDSFIDRFID